MKKYIIYYLITLSSFLQGCNNTSDSSTSEKISKIDFKVITIDKDKSTIPTCGKFPPKEILEVNGNGIALFDADQDNDLDIFIANGSTLDNPTEGPGWILLLQNEKMSFENYSIESGIHNQKSWASGVAQGDIDQDGDIDLVVTTWGHDILLKNNGDTTFTPIKLPGKEKDWGTGVALGDFDQDGDLDIYITNYLYFDPNNPPNRASYKNITVMGGPHGLKPQMDKILQNNGKGQFNDVSSEWGLTEIEPAFGLNVIAGDFNNTPGIELIVGNDSMKNHYLTFKKDSNKKIKVINIGDVSGLSANGDGRYQATMGMASADVDNNGLLDLFTSNFSSDTNTLHLNFGNNLFEDFTAQMCLGLESRTFLGWGSTFCDFDLDQDQDLFIVNGHVYPEATVSTMDSTWKQESLLFENDNSKFKRFTANQYLRKRIPGRTLAKGDINKDGLPDLVIGGLNIPLVILENKSKTQNIGLVLTLKDTKVPGNKNGIGSKIELLQNDILQTRWITSGGSFLSSNECSAFFGIKKNEPFYLTVTWPNGEKNRYHSLELTPRNGTVEISR